MERSTHTICFLELLPADTSDADPALISGVGSDVATLLREQGETVQPVYSGQRGGELLFQIISAVWTNKDIIMSDLSSLVTILTPIVLIAQHIRQAYIKRAGEEIAQQHPVAITLEFKGITLTIEAANTTDATGVATQLAKQIQAQLSSSGGQTSLPPTPKIQAHIPKRPVKKRR